MVSDFLISTGANIRLPGGLRYAIAEFMYSTFKYLIIAGCISVSGCTSKDGDFNLFSPEDDVNLGKQYSAQVLNDTRQFPVLSAELYPEAYEYLENITEKVLSGNHILHRKEFPWEVSIIQNDSILNAFCTPGGYIYVYTGLIKFLDHEDELAGVIGHEIAHADLRHSTEQLTKSYGIQLLVQLIFGSNSMFGDLAGGLVGLSFSRHDETEADMQSVIYLTDTEYDPRGVARFFQKMQEKGESMGDLQFLSTHPNPENRVEKIFAKWKETGGKTGKRNTEAYKKFKKMLP